MEPNSIRVSTEVIDSLLHLEEAKLSKVCILSPGLKSREPFLDCQSLVVDKLICLRQVGMLVLLLWREGSLQFIQ